MTYQEKLQGRILKTGSRLCVGLDPRPEACGGKLAEFCQRVIEQTAPYAAVYKPNTAYFEAAGSAGLRELETVLAAIPRDIPVILDAKRGDISETQRYYARACFETWGADAVTINPYMGRDSVDPFLEYEGKGIYLLGITSNVGSEDIQRQKLADGRYVYEIVSEMAAKHDGVGLVLGLTNAKPEWVQKLPDVPFLVPGLGAQGGDLSLLAEEGRQRTAATVINVSRGILQPGDGETHASRASYFAEEIRKAFSIDSVS